ncbi:MAG TPA: GlsB/YeaQ/YmgE family stress response membrane protein [Candidatus Dietzia intestinigallinarum]|nr:GlsB/YeaQ/YmgE family stress response membrane protein [Candidatus Dietzia intestinigallinarum]
MTIVLWIIIGALAGWIASMIMGKNAQMGAIANIASGIIGALLVAFLASLIPGVELSVGKGNWFVTLIAAIVGACLLIWIVSKIKGRSRV